MKSKVVSVLGVCTFLLLIAYFGLITFKENSSSQSTTTRMTADKQNNTSKPTTKPTVNPTTKPNTIPTTNPTTKPTTKSSSTYSSNSNTNRSSSFTNKFGTATTRCAYPGCSNYIASSGDTNSCTKHSNRCLQCGKYIDYDAMYCMSCLTDAVNKIKKSK